MLFGLLAVMFVVAAVVTWRAFTAGGSPEDDPRRDGGSEAAGGEQSRPHAGEDEVAGGTKPGRKE